MSREQRLALRNFRSRNAVKEEKARVVNTEIITGTQQAPNYSGFTMRNTKLTRGPGEATAKTEKCFHALFLPDPDTSQM